MLDQTLWRLMVVSVCWFQVNRNNMAATRKMTKYRASWIMLCESVMRTLNAWNNWWCSHMMLFWPISTIRIGRAHVISTFYSNHACSMNEWINGMIDDSTKSIRMTCIWFVSKNSHLVQKLHSYWHIRNGGLSDYTKCNICVTGKKWINFDCKQSKALTKPEWLWFFSLSRTIHHVTPNYNCNWLTTLEHSLSCLV